MERNTILISIALIAISIAAFGLVQNTPANASAQKSDSKKQKKAEFIPHYFLNSIARSSSPDFYLDVGSLFRTTVSREQVLEAKTILDLLPQEGTQSLSDFENVQLSLFKKGENRESRKVITSKNELFSTEQVEFLQSLDYSSNFIITANCQNQSQYTGKKKMHNLIYYVTVVPEQEAHFQGASSSLLSYLRKNSQEEISQVDKNQLKSGKMSFTISKEGTVLQPKLESTSGYKRVDKKMLQLIKNISGKWKPANNSKGEKIDQTLFLSFGAQGC